MGEHTGENTWFQQNSEKELKEHVPNICTAFGDKGNGMRKSTNKRRRGRSPVMMKAATVFHILILTLLINGCRSRQDAPSPVDTSVSFSDGGKAKVPSRWWAVFDDPKLQSIVNRALESNFSLQTAWQRLRAARAVVDRESANLFPDLDVFSDVEVSRSNGETSEQLRLGATSTYEVDLWGRIQSQVQAERYRAKATLADYQTAALSLSAEVVRSWFRLAAARKQFRILKQQTTTNKKLLKVLKTRFANGQTPRADVLRQKELLAATRQKEASTRSSIQVLEHQLAVFSGQPPQKRTSYNAASLPQLPPLPDTGLPAELIQRRPDVRRAHNRLRAADQDLAAAISNQYPQLSLTASISSSEDDARQLFNNWARSFAGELTAPLIDAGERQADVVRRRAQKKQRLYEYGQTILTAFQEVEDALVQEKKQKQQLNRIEERLDITERTYEQLRTEYINGAADFIDVLNALDQKQQLRRDVVSEKLNLLQYRIALYRALAGAFETSRESKDGKGSN